MSTVSALESLTGVADGDTRNLLGYYAPGDGGGGVVRRNASSTATRNGGTVFTSADGGRWERIYTPGFVNVRWFGAKGIGSPGAAADDAAFTAAFAALGASGVFYMPTGNYYVNGGYTQGLGVEVVGDGRQATQITHTGNNICFSAYNVTTTSDTGTERAWRRFWLVGNSGSSAAGIVHGNSYGATFEDVRVQDYTAGTAIELRNSTYWTEGTKFDGVHLRNSLKDLAFTTTAPGTDSFANTHFTDVMCECAASGQTALHFGDGIWLYCSTMDIKLHLDAAGATAMHLGANARLGYYTATSQLFPNLYQIGIEMPDSPTTAVGISADGTATLRGNGVISPDLSDPRHSIPSETNIWVGPHNTLPATFLGKSGGSISNYRGGGNAANTYSAVQGDLYSDYTGFGVARGSSIESALAYIYESTSSAFDVRSVPFGQYLSDSTSVFAVDGLGHIQTGGYGPPGIAAGSGAGTSPTVAITGNDTAGYLTVTTGTSPPTTSDALVATVTFLVAFTSAPLIVLLTPANLNTAALTGNMPYVDQASITTTQFTLKKPSATALGASTAYKFYYHVLQ